MAETPDTPKAVLKRRLAKMKRDLDMRAPFINECYRLSMPQRDMVGAARTSPITEDEIQDLMDTTFAEAVDDFSSDMITTFTPAHEPWVKHVPTQALSKPQQQQAKAQIQSAVNWLWDDIQASSYYDAADECFHDLSAGTMAMRRLEYGAAQPICYEPVPTANLRVDVGPDRAPDGRFTDGKITKLHIQANYGRWLDWSSAPKEAAFKFANAKPDALFQVVDGVHKVWDKPGETQWRRVVMIEGEIVYEKLYDEDGACNFYVSRWRTESNSALGIGPGWWACAPARVLIELEALTLGQMHNLLDPAHAYSDPDGGANMEQGISAGDWLQLGEGFKVEKISGDGEFQAAFYTREDLRMMIKSALFQDKPFQRGDTPPSATQWADESARAAQRWEIPRGKTYREWVIPIVTGHQWQRVKHGIFPEIKLGTDGIILKPQSPQAKARSAEKLAKTERTLTTAGLPSMAKAAEIIIDAGATLQNIIDESGDELTKVRSPQEIQDLVQRAQALSQQAQQTQGGGDPAQPAQGQ